MDRPDHGKKAKKKLILESYAEQKKEWPAAGKHILAQYDDDSIVVYQAYNTSIGAYAAEHRKFTGCSAFSPTRMTWVKTNFLWMMYRSGWGDKDKNQAVTLAIWLKREAFERMLENMVHSGYKPDVYGSQEEYNAQVSRAQQSAYGFVRMQWDPDHSPGGSPHPHRRAIQLGLKGVTSFISGEDIIDIQDISNYVAEQSVKKLSGQLETPRERVYVIQNKELAKKLMLSDWDGSAPKDNQAEELPARESSED